MNKRSIVMLATSLALLAFPAAAQETSARKLQPQMQQQQGLGGFGVVTGAGYAAFDAGGAPGNNLYWVSAFGGPQFNRGQWYADVLIEFPGFTFDFEALYTVDCMLVDRHNGQAWIEGTITESNDPANVGLRATLYIEDGGPGGDDYHGITPLASDAPRDNCRQRPVPDFRELAQSGNYIIH